ncbi:MAG: hypothetical protein WAN11_23370 [Syntrophobacteraceae bacterium]
MWEFQSFFITQTPPSMAALAGLMHKHIPPRWYSTDAWYFVTIFTHKRYPYFESKKAGSILMDVCHSVCGRRNATVDG